jgi:hypothetical protein
MSRSVGSVPVGFGADGLGSGGTEATSSGDGVLADGVFIGGGV